VRSHKKFGPDRFSRFDVYWIQTNRQTDKQTDRQAKFIYRFLNIWFFSIDVNNIHIWNNVYLPHRLYPCIYVSFQYMFPCTLGISSTSLSSLFARIPVSLHPCISVSLCALCIPVTLYHCISEPLYPALYLCLLYLCIPVFLYPCIPVSNRIYIYLSGIRLAFGLNFILHTSVMHCICKYGRISFYSTRI